MAANRNQIDVDVEQLRAARRKVNMNHAINAVVSLVVVVLAIGLALSGALPHKSHKHHVSDEIHSR